MSGKTQWVVRRNGGWAVRGQGNSRDTSHHDTQLDAFFAARQIAQHQHSGVVIQRRDGRIRDWRRY